MRRTEGATAHSNCIIRYSQRRQRCRRCYFGRIPTAESVRISAGNREKINR